MQTTDKFNDYLFAPLPEQYPIASIPWSLKMTDAHRKEVLFQQSKFLDAAAQYSAEQPWVSFIAVTKHQRLLEAYEIDTGSLHEIADKEYFEEVQNKAFEVLNSSSAQLDDEALANCERLVDLQWHWASLSNAFDAVKTAQDLDIQSFEPPLKKPDMTLGFAGLFLAVTGLLFIGIATLGFSQLPDSDAEISSLMRTAPLLIGGLFFLMGVTSIFQEQAKKKVENTQRDLYESFTVLRDSFYSAAEEFSDSLGFDANAAATDLSACLQILQGHIEDRKTLENAYLEV